ncbi:MAG: CDP-alcohol phosphatidyltransferase family protein [Flavobacterium sp.]|nr:CDP-alcohol phosphatidyltransferase family protein [Flavobacterium sp.]
MYLKKQLPNILTLLNLFSGCVALLYVFQDNYMAAFGFVCLGIFFDFFDGFFARLFQVSSPLGLQLDSLADMVTSGVVPGVVMYHMLLESAGNSTTFFALVMPYFGFLITLASCYRLANFNLDTRQTNSFIGLPTPANALFILSLPLVAIHSESIVVFELLINHAVLLLITFVSVYMLNAEIPLFALKMKGSNWKAYKLQLGFVLYSVLLLVFLQITAVPLIIISYVLTSVIYNRWFAKPLI